MRVLRQILLPLGIVWVLAGCSAPPKVDARIELTADRRIEQATFPESIKPLLEKEWAHGEQACSAASDRAIDVYQHSETSFILRVSKCVSFEAPFVYLLIGEEKVLVVDTGPSDDTDLLPLYQMIKQLVSEHSDGESKPWLVIHSHSHSDHYGGDAQFEGLSEVTLVFPKAKPMIQFFGFDSWPQGEANIELGSRNLTVLPIPGHQEDSIALYDPQTQWLLTGDTVYPGLIYVKHWQDYRDSVHRLYQFTQTHPVSAVLGAHIEMTTTPGLYYPIGTLYQPNEAPLALSVQELALLNEQLLRTPQPTEIMFDNFVVMPMSDLQKQISNTARWATQ